MITIRNLTDPENIDALKCALAIMHSTKCAWTHDQLFAAVIEIKRVIEDADEIETGKAASRKSQSDCREV
jgi:hypothetical protein